MKNNTDPPREPREQIWRNLPPASVLADRLGLVLREAHVLRGLLRLAEQAEQWMELDRLNRGLREKHEQ